MTNSEFIKKVADLVAKYAPNYGVCVYSPIIAQACLESAYGTSELATKANNYFGLKYNASVSDKTAYIKVGSEQNPDGSYVSSVMQWCNFNTFESGVEGYFKFLFKRTGITRYNNLIGLTDPRKYLETIKAAGYATSISYVDNLMAVINKWNLTQYDTKEVKSMYTDSSLVTYTDICGNYNPRNDAPKYGCIDAIDTITIHHMAGNLTVETCGRVFHNKAGSSNYGVNGKNIGLYVHEKDRSWCSSSRENDFRAVTIEVANNSGAPNWTVSDESLNTTIKLIADICKRNGIKKLVWSDNKADRINHRNGCNMTMHQDFASTACPGPYLSGKERFIADSVNAILSGGTPISTPTPTPTPTPSTNVPFVWANQTVKGVQKFLNTYYKTGLAEDGLFGPNTRKGIAKAYQTELNRFGAGLVVDGFFGGKSAIAFDKYVGRLSSGQAQNIFCTLWQCTLVGFGYKPNGIDGIFGSGCTAATNQLFKHTGLPQDGVVNSSDIDKLM